MSDLSPELMLALVGAGLTVYSILPRARKLRLHLRMRRLDWVAVAGAVALVHYILFYPVLDRLGWALDLGAWRWGFTPSLASYAILVGTAGLVGLRASLTGLSRSRVAVLRELLEDLLLQRRYDELVLLLQDHLEAVKRAYFNDYRLSRLRRRLSPSAGAMHLAALKGEPHAHVPAPVRAMAERLPSYEGIEHDAREAVRRVLSSREAVRAMAQVRPFLGLDVLGARFAEVDHFQDLWWDALLGDPTSVIHYELRENQNLTGGGHRYFINPRNRILTYYFADPRVAKRLEVYRPIGEFALRDLDERRGDPTDRYNRPYGAFQEEEAWNTGLYSSLRLFDLMVSESLHQDIDWHMWLYYLPYFAERVLRNLDPTPEVDFHTEWPTPYHFFLYEIVSMLRSWVGSVQDVPAGQANCQLDGINTQHANGNIPKSAALALGVILHRVLLSDRVSDRFKRYLFDIPLMQARRLIEDGTRADYGRLLVLTTAQGGYAGVGSAAYRQAADAAFAVLDHPLRFFLEAEWNQHAH